MSANPNWAKWVFASVATALKQVAIDSNIPCIVEQLDHRSEHFMATPSRAEIRISGPFLDELSLNYFHAQVYANVLLTSVYGDDPYFIQKASGLFQSVMSSPIPVFRYGNEAGDDQSFIDCLNPQGGRAGGVKVFHFGPLTETDKVKQSAIDARYSMYLVNEE